MNDARSNAPPSGRLLQVLGVAFGLAVLVGNTIGMGILRTPGEVAARVPSVPLFMAVWAAGALYALLGALTVAELSAMRPLSGGQFPLVHYALGPYAGFVTGWTDWLSTSGSVAAVAIVFGEYVGPLIAAFAGHAAIIASSVVVLFAVLQWRGIRFGDAAQRYTSLLKALSLVTLAIVALVMSGHNIPNAAPSIASAGMPNGVALAGAVIVALQSVIYTYDGWTGPVYFAEEIQDPGRAIPRTMIGGVLLVMVIYLLLNAAFLRVIPIREMAGDPFVAASAAVRLFGPRGDTVLRLVMLVSLIATVNALQLMASRVPYAMSRAKLFPKMFQRVNAGGTPVPAHFASAALALLFIVTNTFDSVLALLAFLFVANYAMTFSTLFVLRIREPLTPRPFRVPWYPIVPALAVAGSVAFMVASLVSDRSNSMRALALVALSWPVYRLIRWRAEKD